jgi:hypothetical protein
MDTCNAIISDTIRHVTANWIYCQRLSISQNDKYTEYKPFW